jgi:hypothetical protein
MQAPRLPALFSLFRQRGPRGFDPVTRYYDPVKEEREQRLERLRKEHLANGPGTYDPELFSRRMRHSWQRQSSDRSHLVRLVLIMSVVMIILYYLVRTFGLLEHWNG